MALETATYISDLVSTNPTASDNISQGDDHIRLLKSSIKATFPNINGAVTATQAELNILDGVTASTAELNILDGLTASTAELNYVDGVTSNIQTQLNAITTNPSLSGNLTLTDTDTGSGPGPILTLLRDSASPAANDVLGQLRFSGEDSLGNSTIYGVLETILIDPTEGSEDASIRFRNMSAGTLTEALRINENNKLLVGTTSYLDGWNSSQNLILAGNSNPGLSIFQAGANTSPGVVTFTKSRGSNPGDTTAVANNDTIGAINFAGADGTSARVSAARISSEVDGTPGTNDMPGRLVFMTTADGASGPSERFRINNAGALGIGGSNFGTSGQVLTSGGSNAAPTWATLPDSGGMTLLGTLTTTSGSTQTLSSLTLTGYRQLYISGSNVSLNAARALQINSVTFTGQLGSASNSHDFGLIVDLLNNGAFISFGVSNNGDNSTVLSAATSTSGTSGYVGRCGYTTASTSITFTATGTTNFDSGTIRVYGVK